MKKKALISLRTLLLLLGLLPIIICSVTLMVVASSKVLDTMYSNMTDKLKVAAEDLAEHYEDEMKIRSNFYETDKPDYSQIDLLVEDGIHQTLFQGDTRLYTSIKNETGERNEGTKADAAIWETVKEGNDYTAKNVEIAGDKYLVYYTPVETASGEVWGMAFSGESMQKIHETNKTVIESFIIVAIVLVIVIGLIVLLIAAKIAKVAKLLTKKLDLIASGDLQKYADIHTSTKEFWVIHNSVESLRTTLVNIIGSINSTVDTISNTSTTMTSEIHTASDNVANISSVSEELSASTEMIAASSQEISASTQEMFSSVEQLVDQTEQGNATVNAMHSKAEEVQNQCAVKLQAIFDILKQKKVSLDEAIEKAKKVNEINALTESILEISSSTNLLALNASIEAARAGDAGKGFAVVADNIRTLADESKSTASNIQTVNVEVVGAVTDLMNTANEIMKIMSEKIEQDYGMFSAMGKDYYNDADTMAGIFDDYSKNTSLLKDTTEQIVQAIDGVANSISECASGVQDVATNVVDIATELNDIGELSNNNSANVNTLSGQVEKFKL